MSMRESFRMARYEQLGPERAEVHSKPRRHRIAAAAGRLVRGLDESRDRSYGRAQERRSAAELKFLDQCDAKVGGTTNKHIMDLLRAAKTGLGSGGPGEVIGAQPREDGARENRWSVRLKNPERPGRRWEKQPHGLGRLEVGMPPTLKIGLVDFRVDTVDIGISTYVGPDGVPGRPSTFNSQNGGDASRPDRGYETGLPQPKPWSWTIRIDDETGAATATVNNGLAGMREVTVESEQIDGFLVAVTAGINAEASRVPVRLHAPDVPTAVAA